MIRDATKELEEENTQEIEDDDEHDSDDDFEISKEIRKMVPSIVVLMKISFSLIKKVTEMLVNVNEEDPKWSDKVVDSGSKISELIDQLGSSVYDDDAESTVQLAKELQEANEHLKELMMDADLNLKDDQKDMIQKFLNLLKTKEDDTLSKLVKLSIQ